MWKIHAKSFQKVESMQDGLREFIVKKIIFWEVVRCFTYIGIENMRESEVKKYVFKNISETIHS